MLETSILFYIMLFCCGIVFFGLFVKLFRLKIWVLVRNKRHRLDKVGYLKHSNSSGEAAEVFLAGGGTRHPIGRVILDENSDKGYVEILQSEHDDDSENQKFCLCGYIDSDGYIYKQISKTKKPERIGYTARPSHPDEPTIYGERSWKTLWLVKKLHAYLGNPPMETLPNVEDQSPNQSNIGHNVYNNPVSPDETTGESEVPGTPSPEEMTDETLSQQDKASDTPSEAQAPSDAPSETPSETPSEAPSETPSDTPSDSPSDTTPDSESVSEKPSKDESGESESAAEPVEKKGKKAKSSGKRKRKKKKEPVAVCYQNGFRSTRSNPIPSEARACAFAVFFNSYNKKKYAEYYRNHPYGWRDTALLTTLIYCGIFLVLYSISVCLLGLPLLGENLKSLEIMIAFYYLLWVLVRQIKIVSIEYSSTIQPKLDMLNKSVGQNAADIIIIFLSCIAMLFTLFYYDFDFIPLLWSIGFGTAVNLSLRKNREKWAIMSTFQEEDEESDTDEVKLPDGDISRSYEWVLDSVNFSKENSPHGNLTIYFSAEEMADIRKMNPFFAQRSEHSYKEYILEMFHFMKSHPSLLIRTKYIKNYILNTAKAHFIQNELDIIQFTLDFVQEPNIKFNLNQDSKSINQFQDYIRFPDETLYDKEGDCNSKSLLAVMLFHLMGHNMLYMYSRTQQHSAIGIELTEKLAEHCVNTDQLKIVEYNGKKYIFCETTGDEIKIGQILEGMLPDDFEDRIELPYSENNNERAPVAITATRLYNWDLDSVFGPQNKLKGSLAIEFDTEGIQELREINPFRTYGADGNTYEQNIRNMFAYVFADDERYKKIKLVADYIRESIQKAGLPELDLLQFTLDFAQVPNITYNKDEDSSSIGFPKEYMRFPDEVLFDKEGDCDCKSSLTCALFHQLGYNVIFMLGVSVGHAAVGVELKEEWLDAIKPEKPETVIREYNGKKYILCETTGDGNKIGITTERSIQDFDTIVELSV